MNDVIVNRFPLQLARLQFGPDCIAKTDHRQTVVPAQRLLFRLRALAILVHEEQLDDSPVRRTGKQLPQNALVAFVQRCHPGAIVHGILHDDEVRLMCDDIALHAERTIAGIRRADAGIHKTHLQARERSLEPLGKLLNVAMRRILGVIPARRDGTADRRNTDRLAAPRLGEHGLKASRIAIADKAALTHQIGNGRLIAQQERRRNQCRTHQHKEYLQHGPFHFHLLLLYLLVLSNAGCVSLFAVHKQHQIRSRIRRSD